LRMRVPDLYRRLRREHAPLAEIPAELDGLLRGNKQPGASDSPDPVTPLPLVADPCTAPNDPSTDPGVQPLTGYAFLADDTASLADALKKTMKYIREKAFTFMAPTVPSVRLTDTENIYISSFRPTTTPFGTVNSGLTS